MSTEIRRAELSDVDEIGELHAFCWVELYAGVLPDTVLNQLSPATMSGLWRKFVSRGGEYAQWVAVADGEVVGFVGIGPGRDPGYELAKELYFIYVAPNHRRTGVGRDLVKQADADYLWIWDANRESQKFYRKLKYFPDSVARNGSLFGSHLPEIRMSH
jgi:GNAT superfamily N-acetyltransferase